MKHERSIFAPEPGTLSAAVLVLADTNALSLAAAVDPMRAANRQSGRALFAWRWGNSPL